jgi:hypothetical protein
MSERARNRETALMSSVARQRERVWATSQNAASSFLLQNGLVFRKMRHQGRKVQGKMWKVAEKQGLGIQSVRQIIRRPVKSTFANGFERARFQPSGSSRQK